jgi:hypothetical protein
MYIRGMDTTTNTTGRQRGNNYHGAKWIRREKRLAIYLRDGLACAYCGATIEDGALLSLDHLTPYSAGGSNHQSNLVTCCQKCNSARQDRPVEEFVAAVAGYLGVDAGQIAQHIRVCRERDIDVAAAKALINKRGSYSAALSTVTR